MLESTMQDFPLTISAVLRHGQAVYPDSEIVTWTDAGPRRASFATVGVNANRLAHVLAKLGVQSGDRVATFMWNSQEHMEAYLAIPSMGAVLHTLNIRLFPEQLAYVVNHGAAKVILLDDSLVPLLAKVAARPQDGRAAIVVSATATSSVLGTDVPVARYADLIAGEPDEFEWPDIDERQAAAMCYTSGTTGNPKGVAYSHRSSFLHSLVGDDAERARLLRARPHTHDRADVPRQRVGHPVRRVHVRRRPRDAGPVPAGRTADAHGQGGARHVLGCGARRSGPTSSATAKRTRSTCRRCG